METKVNVLSDSEHELEVKLNYSEIQSEIEEAYKKERKSISMPGFRKGKVPISMLKKVYGDAIEYKASEDIANKKYWDVVKEKDLKPISMPQMTDLDFQMSEYLSFKVKYEVKPKLEVKDYKGLEIEKPVFKVKEEDVEAEVKNMLKSKAKFDLAEVVEDDNYRITVDLQRIDENGKDIEGGKSENMLIDLSDPKVNENIKKNAQNKKAGETFEFSFTDKHSHGDHEHEEKYIYTALLKKIEKINMPEISEELMGQLSGKKAKTLDELNDFTKSNYEKYYSDQSERIFENSLLNEIVKRNDFDPPKGYIETILSRMVETEKQNAQQYKQPIPDDKILRENFISKAEWNAKWQIIMENIAEKENLEVTDDDLKKLAETEAEKVGIPADKLVKYYKDSNRKESMIEEKVFEFLKQNTKIKEIDADEKAKEAKEKRKSEIKSKKSEKKSENKK